jgi:undecaprenyl-diphosphatase
MVPTSGKKKPTAKPKAKPKTRAKPATRPKSGRKPSERAKTAAKKPRKSPEQKLGDTPVAPWDMPTPQEKEKAKPVRRALRKAVAEVDSQKKADKVIEHLEQAAAGQTAEQVKKEQPTSGTTAAAKKIEKTEKAAPKPKKAERVLEETGRALTTDNKRQREVVSEAVQEMLNPEQQGAAPENEEQREFLQQAVLKRLKPLDALDANLFLKVNHLPHSRALNALFYGLTFVFTGGAAWYALMGLSALRDQRQVPRLLRKAALPLAVAGLIVEHPIKAYFKRRRPFITIIQAIVIGRKPGTWSFPSGHSATAFGGAWLLNGLYPRWWPLRYLLASSVAFSRIYLGDHYPGDVISGSLLGMVLSMAIRKVFNRR